MDKKIKHYSLEDAAGFIQMSVAKLKILIETGGIGHAMHEGEVYIPKDEVDRYADFAEDSRPPASIKEFVPGLAVYSSEPADTNDDNIFEIKDEKLIKLKEEYDWYCMRINNIPEKIRRLEAQFERYNNIADGKAAEFWMKASTVLGTVLKDKQSSAERRGSKLFIFKDKPSGIKAGELRMIIKNSEHLPGFVKDLLLGYLENHSTLSNEIMATLGLKEKK